MIHLALWILSVLFIGAVAFAAAIGLILLIPTGQPTATPAKVKAPMNDGTLGSLIIIVGFIIYLLISKLF